MTSRISIVFHSGYGHTRQVAQAVAQGSGADLIEIDQEGRVSEQDWARLAASDAIVFGTPTYMGNVSWQFKRFQDTTTGVWMNQQWKNKLAAGFTNSAGINGDKLATLNSLFTFTQQHGMLWVGTGMLPANAKASVRDDVNYLASFSGLMAATPSDASADELVAGDLRTARLFGERIREVVQRLH
ncbi:MAG TPA: flavodoxin family protein [Hydrogenophaga sp.]|uniref:flavodoxin family protein n=1 Tax=Hydrogenophaga sp. TaxID=1904254 RepID=UPI002C392A1C|nr:flavodoxin family protein [Hydrogenophaga sp.]HSX93657.1 flavodoxin family protein [Hydrogenophaga sp.]